MNLTFSLFFVCIFVHLIDLCNSTVLSDALLDKFVAYQSNYALSEWSEKDKFNLHHAFVIEELKWKFGLIPFKIDENFNDDDIYKMLLAMYEIENSSCIRFAAHDPIYGPNYVMIQEETEYRCGSANLGCLNMGEQNLWIASECLDDFLHEMLHTIGFSHHQSRADRDKYISINIENLNISDADFIAAFSKVIDLDVRVKYLTPFDYESVMLYDKYVYSKNNEPVITAKIEGAKIQPSKGVLSKYDKVLLNRFYDCESVDKRKSKIFYEDEFGLSYPPVINYHEISRAKKYLVNKELVYESDNNEEKRATDVDEENQNADDEAVMKKMQNNLSPSDDVGVMEYEQIQYNTASPDIYEEYEYQYEDEKEETPKIELVRKKRAALVNNKLNHINGLKKKSLESLMDRKKGRKARKQRRIPIRFISENKVIDW